MNDISDEQKPHVIYSGIALALMPLISFAAQYLFSVHAGTQYILFHHLTVTVVDWIFIPFNFFVVRVIDWHRGGRIYLITCISVILNVLTHAYWQYNQLDLGHMIKNNGAVLPAGWTHLSFSILETILLFAFVFCRKSESRSLRTTSIFAVLYFLSMGICGYIMHNRFIASDIIVCFSGLFFVLLYPSIVGSQSLQT
ncbi:MAG TPA: hypothetical protein VFK06_12430 [Candidatus Angelobacter sp.]|nr:hypothetical protein [Candidatus Angelobacter sp.]